MRTGAVVDDEATPTSSSIICNETAKEAVQRRIKLLRSVHATEDGWRNIVLGRDDNSYCTKLKVFEIVRQRSTFLCCAYQVALTSMNERPWHDCCKMAYTLLNSLGFSQATFFKTVANWNKVFRQLEGLPHPNPYVLQCEKRHLPPLLEVFPYILNSSIHVYQTSMF